MVNMAGCPGLWPAVGANDGPSVDQQRTFRAVVLVGFHGCLYHVFPALFFDTGANCSKIRKWFSGGRANVAMQKRARPGPLLFAGIRFGTIDIKRRDKTVKTSIGSRNCLRVFIGESDKFEGPAALRSYRVGSPGKRGHGRRYRASRPDGIRRP